MKNNMRTISIFTLSIAISTLANASTIVHYVFDGDAQDVSGNGNDGTIFGAPTFVAGEAGSAIYIDNPFGGISGDKFVQLPNSPSISGLNNSSISFAIRYKSLDTAQNNGRLFGGIDGSMTGIAFNYNAGATPEAYGAFYGSNSTEPFGHGLGLVDPNGITTDGNWHWSVVTLDRSMNLVTLYADSNVITSEVYGTLGSISLSDLAIGRANGVDPSITFYSARLITIGDFRLYDAALTPAEVQTLVSTPIPESNSLTVIAIALTSFSAALRFRKNG